MKKTLSLSYGSGRLLLSRGYPVQESYSAVLRASEVVSHFTSASDSLSRIWLSVFGAPGNTLDLGMVNSSLTDLNDSVSYLQADLPSFTPTGASYVGYGRSFSKHQEDFF